MVNSIVLIITALIAVLAITGIVNYRKLRKQTPQYGGTTRSDAILLTGVILLWLMLVIDGICILYFGIRFFFNVESLISYWTFP